MGIKMDMDMLKKKIVGEKDPNRRRMLLNIFRVLQLRNAIKTCMRCSLHEVRTQAVPWSGPILSRIAFVGEAPGQQEDIEGKPFVGPAGKLLDKLFIIAGLSREAVCIFNVVCCRPPNNRVPSIEEIQACSSNFRAQLELIDPDIVVTLGSTALSQFKAGKISSLHGKFFESQGRIIFPTYHPAAALRDKSRMSEICKDFRTLGILSKDKEVTNSMADLLITKTFERVARMYRGNYGLDVDKFKHLDDEIDNSETITDLRKALIRYVSKAEEIFKGVR